MRRLSSLDKEPNPPRSGFLTCFKLAPISQELPEKQLYIKLNIESIKTYREGFPLQLAETVKYVFLRALSSKPINS
jgi:hypothetical protein